MSLKPEQQWPTKCLLVRRVDIWPHCGWTREEKGTFNGLQGNIIFGDALWQEQCTGPFPGRLSWSTLFFPPSFWLLVLWWTGSLFHCMLCFSFILRQCSTHSVHLCHYTPNDLSERWFSSPESNIQWELGLSPAVLAANVVIMHFIQVLVITSQGTGVWALFGFFLFCFSREQLQLAKLLFLYNWATVLAKRKTR